MSAEQEQYRDHRTRLFKHNTPVTVRCPVLLVVVAVAGVPDKIVCKLCLTAAAVAPRVLRYPTLHRRDHLIRVLTSSARTSTTSVLSVTASVLGRPHSGPQAVTGRPKVCRPQMGRPQMVRPRMGRLQMGRLQIRSPQMGLAVGRPQVGLTMGRPQVGLAMGRPQVGRPQMGLATDRPQVGLAMFRRPQVGLAAGRPQVGRLQMMTRGRSLKTASQPQKHLQRLRRHPSQSTRGQNPRARCPY